MSDIKLFKLSNGEEIVARKKEEKLETLCLEQPMSVQAVPDGNTGEMGIALFPWLMAAKDNDMVELSVEHIIVETVPKEVIEKSYLSKITGLTL